MKILITTYTFNASAKTVTFTGYGSIALKSVLLITNVTDNIIIYNFSDPSKGGSVATNVLTLDYDTTSMDNADELQIFYDDPTATQSIGALPAGTNNIGDIDVLSVVPGTSATALGKGEDNAHTNGDTGVMALAVRQDSEGSMVSASGDYAPLIVDATGKLRTSVAGTVLHDSVDAGAPVKIGGKASSSAPADVAAGDRTDAYFDLKGRLKVDASDVPISANPSTATGAAVPSTARYIGLNDLTTGNLVGARALSNFTNTTAGIMAAGMAAVFDDTSPTAITENSFGAVRMSVNRNVYTTLRDAAGNERGLNIGASGDASVSVISALPAGNNNIGDVDIASSVLPTGASTSALQTTGNTSLATIAGAVSGTEMQVDVLTMPTTTIQATNLDIRDLDETTDSIAPHGKYTASFSSLSDGDTTQLRVTDNGELMVGLSAGVNISGPVQVEGTYGVLEQLDIATPVAATTPLLVAMVDGDGDQITSFGGGTQYAEAATTAPATGTAALGRYVASPAGTLTDGQMSMPLMDNYGQLKVVPVGTITVQATNLDIRDLASGSDSVAAVQSGTWAVTANAGTNLNTSALALESGGNLATIAGAIKAEDTAHTTGDTGIMAMAVRSDSEAALAGASGDYIPLMTDASGKLRTSTAGTVVHDATDAGAPVKIGNKATTGLSAATLVANGDRTDAFAGVDGVPIVRPHSPLEDLVDGNASNTDGTSTQVIATSGSGVKTYLTSITLTNTSASNIIVELKDGSTTRWTFPVPANGGVTHTWNTPLGGTANTAWNFDPSAATTTVYCSANGFKSKV